MSWRRPLLSAPTRAFPKANTACLTEVKKTYLPIALLLHTVTTSFASKCSTCGMVTLSFHTGFAVLTYKRESSRSSIDEKSAGHGRSFVERKLLSSATTELIKQHTHFLCKARLLYETPNAQYIFPSLDDAGDVSELRD